MRDVNSSDATLASAATAPSESSPQPKGAGDAPSSATDAAGGAPADAAGAPTHAAGKAADSAGAPSDAAGEAPPNDLGVLFVHGIGQQERGTTLVAFGEPIHAWLSRWFDGIARSWRPAGLTMPQFNEWFDRVASTWRERGEGAQLNRRFDTLRSLFGNLAPEPAKASSAQPPLESVPNGVADGILAASATLRDAQIRAASEGAPSHAPLELHAVATDGTVHASRWMLAESWWAEAFWEPEFRQLGLWLLGVLPWTLGTHFGLRVRRAWRAVRSAASTGARVMAAAELTTGLLMLALSVPLALVGETVIILILLLALLPVPRLRAALAAFERTLAATLGDSLVLLASPLQRAAMVAQVQRDVAWLATRCRRVAVVAHSQGGAVAHLALRDQRPGNVVLLVTFGSGLRKLEEMRQMAATDEWKGGRAMLAVLSPLLVGWQFLRVAVWHVELQPWGIAVGIALYLLVLASYLARYPALDISWYSQRFEQEGLMWADCYSSADPVPNGALQDYEPELRLPQSWKVFNERSFLSDHTTYWRNTEEFVASVAWYLTRCVGEPWTRIVTLKGVAGIASAIRRRWRVSALAGGRWAGTLSALWLFYARRVEWRELGVWLWSLGAAAIDKVNPWLTLASPAPRPSTETLAVTLGTFILLFATARLARFSWDRWGEEALVPYFLRREPEAPAGRRDDWLGQMQRFNLTYNARLWPWCYFTFVAGQIAIAAWYTPWSALAPLTARNAFTVATVVGFVVMVIFDVLVHQAVKRIPAATVA